MYLRVAQQQLLATKLKAVTGIEVETHRLVLQLVDSVLVLAASTRLMFEEVLLVVVVVVVVVVEVLVLVLVGTSRHRLQSPLRCLPKSSCASEKCDSKESSQRLP